MRDLYLLPECPRAVRLFLDNADNGPQDGLGLRLARAVDKACAELTTDPATSGRDVVLRHLLEQGPIDEKGGVLAERMSAAWSRHWAVRGVAASSWRKAEGLSFTSADGRMTVRAQLRVIHQSTGYEHVILYRVGRVPEGGPDETAALAQLAVIREAAPAVLARQVYLSGLIDLGSEGPQAAAAYQSMAAVVAAREAACDRTGPVPPVVTIPGCKRCRMAGACGPAL